MFIPIVNCGINAGESPLIWDGEPFTTKEECERWIEDNQDNFTMNELGGCVYPHEM